METLRGVMERSRLLAGTLDHSEFIGIGAILHVDVPNRKQKRVLFCLMVWKFD